MMGRMLVAWMGCVVLAGGMGVRGAEGDVYSPEKILGLMRKTNEYQKAHPRMKEDDRNWERGTWYIGVMACWKATGEKEFLDQAMAWGKQHQWQVGTEPYGANRFFCVQTWAELYFEKKDPAMIEPAIKWVTTDHPKSPFGPKDKKWYYEGTYAYADSLYGASGLAMLTKATGDKKFLDIMHTYFWDIADELLDKEEGLFYRDKRFIGQKNPNGKKIIWSRGNGWVLGGIVRVLEYLPEDDPKREKYVTLFRTMAASVAKRQQADGLWRTNLADPEQVPTPESSGTGFFCYALAWGMNHGILDRATYEPVVKKAWAGLVSCVDEEGRIKYGQRVGDRPVAVKVEDYHEYVTGTFLVAGSEMYRMGKTKK